MHSSTCASFGEYGGVWRGGTGQPVGLVLRRRTVEEAVCRDADSFLVRRLTIQEISSSSTFGDLASPLAVPPVFSPTDLDGHRHPLGARISSPFDFKRTVWPCGDGGGVFTSAREAASASDVWQGGAEAEGGSRSSESLQTRVTETLLPRCAIVGACNSQRGEPPLLEDALPTGVSSFSCEDAPKKVRARRRSADSALGLSRGSVDPWPFFSSKGTSLESSKKEGFSGAEGGLSQAAAQRDGASLVSGSFVQRRRKTVPSPLLQRHGALRPAVESSASEQPKPFPTPASILGLGELPVPELPRAEREKHAARLRPASSIDAPSVQTEAATRLSPKGSSAKSLLGDGRGASFVRRRRKSAPSATEAVGSAADFFPSSGSAAPLKLREGASPFEAFSASTEGARRRPAAAGSQQRASTIPLLSSPPWPTSSTQTSVSATADGGASELGRRKASRTGEWLRGRLRRSLRILGMPRGGSERLPANAGAESRRAVFASRVAEANARAAAEARAETHPEKWNSKTATPAAATAGRRSSEEAPTRRQSSFRRRASLAFAFFGRLRRSAETA